MTLIAAVNETALGVTPGQKVCFKVIPKPKEVGGGLPDPS